MKRRAKISWKWKKQTLSVWFLCIIIDQSPSVKKSEPAERLSHNVPPHTQCRSNRMWSIWKKMLLEELYFVTHRGNFPARAVTAVIKCRVEEKETNRHVTGDWSISHKSTHHLVWRTSVSACRGWLIKCKKKKRKKLGLEATNWNPCEEKKDVNL